MKSVKIRIFTLTVVAVILLLCIGLFSAYVYIGTYLFPIAPYWITQLPPNPPSPEINHGEFNFKITYSIDETLKNASGTVECYFDGYKVKSIGGPKQRIWCGNIKNTNNCESFHFRDEERIGKKSMYSSVCIENIDSYKIVLHLPDAEYFMGEHNNKSISDTPSIQVYDTKTKYYLIPTQSDVFLNEHKFELVNWYCEGPIQNKFH